MINVEWKESSTHYWTIYSSCNDSDLTILEIKLQNQLIRYNQTFETCSQWFSCLFKFTFILSEKYFLYR